MWTNNVIRHILSRIGKSHKVDNKSEEESRGLFSTICVEMDISRPLKRNTKYGREGILCECLRL